MRAEVTWKLEGNSLLRSETISAKIATTIKRYWLAIPSTANSSSSSTTNGLPIYRLRGKEGTLEVAVTEASFPLEASLQATGNGEWGRGSRGPVPLMLNFRASDLSLKEGQSLNWTIRLT